ncbi:hypothetical protein C8Q77DRAFT_27635 [Trametes polyzona]|nr:hypothetical protein C8Q77DRAFT_27635 [Trametes polyzona]
MTKHKYYAVHNGREGTKIYTTWEETKANTSRFSGAIHKSFRSLPEARAWLLGVADAAAADASPSYTYPGTQSGLPLASQPEPMTQEGASQIPVPPILVKEEQVDEWPDEEFFHDNMEVDDRTLVDIPRPAPQSQRDVPMSEPTQPTAKPPIPIPVPPSVPGPAPEIKLSADQQRVLDMVKRGDSVFFTGSAGTGKSVLLREIIKLRGGRPSIKLGVTASTGIASVNIGGCTLHSWAGIGLGKEDKDALVGKILGISMKAYKLDKKRRDELKRRQGQGEILTGAELAFLNAPPEERKNKVLDRWRECKTLIIDEISMIDGKLFDKLEYVGRQLRQNELPFGGIQVSTATLTFSSVIDTTYPNSSFCLAISASFPPFLTKAGRGRKFRQPSRSMPNLGRAVWDLPSFSRKSFDKRIRLSSTCSTPCDTGVWTRRPRVRSTNSPGRCGMTTVSSPPNFTLPVQKLRAPTALGCANWRDRSWSSTLGTSRAEMRTERSTLLSVSSVPSETSLCPRSCR